MATQWSAAVTGRWTVWLGAVTLAVSLLGAPSTAATNEVAVKYRTTPVDFAAPGFEHKDTSSSSFIGGAWYDASNQYMVIRLSGTYYHYCRMPAVTWAQFKAAESFGKIYNASIKGRYDCREGGAPDYSPH